MKEWRVLSVDQVLQLRRSAAGFYANPRFKAALCKQNIKKKSGDKREEANALRESPAERAPRVNESAAIKERSSLWRCWRRAMKEATKTER